MDRFDFDSILFPFDFPLWIKTKFGQSVYKRAKEAGMGIMALKAMAHQQWPPGEKRKWSKTFYEPFDEIDQAALGLRFTLHLPVTAMFPPGHWELFKMALDHAGRIYGEAGSAEQRHLPNPFIGGSSMDRIVAFGILQDQSPLTVKITIGACVWLITAALAYGVWGLLKIISKIGVIAFPLLVGLAVMVLLPDRPSNEQIVSIGANWIVVGLAITLNCYLYASIYNIEAILKRSSKN